MSENEAFPKSIGQAGPVGLLRVRRRPETTLEPPDTEPQQRPALPPTRLPASFTWPGFMWPGGKRRTRHVRQWLALHMRSVPSRLREEEAYGHDFLFLPVIIGAGAAFWFLLPGQPAVGSIVFLLALFTAISIAVRQRPGISRLIPLVPMLFAAGMLLAQFQTWRYGTIMLDSPVTTQVVGVVERREVDASERWRYLVRVLETVDPQVKRPPQHAWILARSRHTPFESGEAIGGRARLSPPSGPALPGLNDFAFSAYFDGIGAVGFFYGAPQRPKIQPPSQTVSQAVKRWLFDLRGAIAQHIRTVVPGDAGAFAAAIVTDERRAISKQTTEALRVAGLAHIIAISGLNMALAGGIFFVGLRMLLSLFTGIAQAYPLKKLAALGALMMVTAYYLISGFGVSAERAYIMMAVMLVAVLFDRASISLRNVALSALIIIVMSPSEILGPSFQMSFSATAALVAGYAFWQRHGKSRGPTATPIRHPLVTGIGGLWKLGVGILITSLIGGVSTAIYSIEHFHRIATYDGLIANLAAMPIISFIVMPAGLIGMLLMPFGLDAPFLKLMGAGLQMVIVVAEHVAGWEADLDLGRQHRWFLPLATAGFLLLILMRTWIRLAGLPLIGLAICLSSLSVAGMRPDLLVSEDGTLVVLVNGRDVATNRSRPPDFIYSQWQRALLLDRAEGPTVLKPPDSSGNQTERRPAGRPEDLTPAAIATARAKMETAYAGRFICEPRAWCAAVSEDGVVVIAIEDGRYSGIACDVGHLVIAARARFDTCRSGALMINGQMLRKTGALEISFNDTIEISQWQIDAALAGREGSVDRAWTQHRHYDWRSRSFNRDLPEPFRQLISAGS